MKILQLLVVVMLVDAVLHAIFEPSDEGEHIISPFKNIGLS